MSTLISAAATSIPSIPRFEEMEGHELLVPIGDLTSSEQARLLAHSYRLGLVDEALFADPLLALETGSMPGIADFLDFLTTRFAPDPDGMQAFTSGKGGLVRAVRLAIAYVNQLY